MSKNLSGAGWALDAVSYFIRLPGWVRFVYYASAVTLAPIKLGVTRDAFVLLLVVATDRLPLLAPVPRVVNSLLALSLIILTPQACNTLTVLTMPIQWALGTIAACGWGFHLLRAWRCGRGLTRAGLVPAAEIGRWRALAVMVASLTLTLLNLLVHALNPAGFPGKSLLRGRASP